MLGDTDGAIDAAQEVFIIVLNKQDEYKEDHPVSLLWRIATNQCLKALRNPANRFRAPEGETLLERIACSGDVEVEVESRSVLRKLFDQHPESSRTIATLHLIDGMTLKETARVMNMSESGVRKRLRGLRNTLKELEEV
jgi:RNA polymerase sigma-70 factor (ECF subfamily)